MVLAKEDFLWFKRGQDVPDSEVAKHPNWTKHLASEVSVVAAQPSKVESKKEEKKKK